MNTPKTLSHCDVISLSDEGWKIIEKKAKQFGINLTELWQKIANQEIILVEAEKMEDLLDTIDGLEGLLSAKEEETISWEQIKSDIEKDE